MKVNVSGCFFSEHSVFTCSTFTSRKCEINASVDQITSSTTLLISFHKTTVT